MPTVETALSSSASISASRKVPLSVAVVGSLLLLPALGLKQFFTRGEAREALVMQDIFERGNWVLAHGYGGAVPSKPPFMHWIAAVLSWPIGGVSEYTARLPSALFSIFAATLMAAFLAKRRGGTVGLAAGVMLLTSVEWFRASTVARVDMTLAACLAGGLNFFYEWFEHRRVRYFVGSILLLSGATLTKGPVAIVLPAMIIGLFLLSEGRNTRSIFGVLFSICVPVILIASAWYVVAYLTRPEEFLAKFWYENVARFLGTQEDEPHRGTFIGLWATMLVGLLPWVVWIIPKVWKATTDLSKVRMSSLRAWWGSRDALDRFCLISLAVVLVFFAIPTSKRSVYLLPAYPFAIGLLAPAVVAVVRENKRWLGIAQRVLPVVILLITCAAALLLYRDEWFSASLPQKLVMQLRYFAEVWKHEATTRGLILLMAVSAPAALGLYQILSKAWRQRALAWVLAYPLIVYGVLDGCVFPLFANSLSAKPFAEMVRAKTAATESLYSFNTEYYGVSFYLGRPIARFEDVLPRRGLVVLNRDDLASFEKILAIDSQVEVLAEAATWVTKPGDTPVLVSFEPSAKQTGAATQPAA